MGLTMIVNEESSQAISWSSSLDSRDLWCAARIRITPNTIINTKNPTQTTIMIATAWPERNMFWAKVSEMATLRMNEHTSWCFCNGFCAVGQSIVHESGSSDFGFFELDFMVVHLRVVDGRLRLCLVTRFCSWVNDSQLKNAKQHILKGFSTQTPIKLTVWMYSLLTKRPFSSEQTNLKARFK